MEFYGEPAFFVILAPLALVAAALGLRGRSLALARYGCLASLVMLYLLFFRSVPSLLYASCYIIASLFLYQWVRGLFERKDPHALALYRVALAVQIAPLALYKVGVLFAPDFPGFLGISYITFKAVQVLIEVRDGLIDDMGPFEYLYFLAFFPTFTSGPILRSRAFVDDIRTPLTRDTYADRLYRGIGWFVVGAAYKFVAASLAQWALWFVPTVAKLPVLAWLAQAFFYGLDLFFDFAGYSYMAMGVGLVLGIQVPRNFHLPFLATDIKEFWDRWHITLSTWLRDFVFMRFTRFALGRKLFSDRVSCACVGFMLNMTLMGVWHGITLDYIVYGIYHGLLLAGYHVFQQKSSFYKKHRRERWFKVVSWAITMIAVFFGFALFGGYVFG